MLSVKGEVIAATSSVSNGFDNKATTSNINAGARTVTSQDGETLSKIARREYGNVNCWVYIYEANASRLGNNAANIRPGMVLYLPSLTDQQLAITKEEAHARYEAL